MGLDDFDVSSIRANTDQIRTRIADAGADPDKVTIVAVTKGFGSEAVVAAGQAGFSIVGESYAQELQVKWPLVVDAFGDSDGDPPEVHFIGHLQSNKIRKLTNLVSVWQSIDRRSVADELARRSPGARILLQLAIGGNVAQGGCPVELAPEFLRHCRDLGLEVEGCMAIGAQGDPARVRHSFDEAIRFADDHGLDIRSLGMTGDLEQAVLAGSTMIRVGTALFGPRPSR
jgi:uncharacterized pyridoxal phosphate-containing UPF0001 family protein